MATNPKPNSPTLESNTVINGYAIESVLGQGRAGVTYLGRDTRTGSSVAIKEYLPRSYAGRQPDGSVRSVAEHDAQEFAIGRRHFLREAQVLKTVDHPNVVKVLDAFEEMGTAYMVMRYEQGESVDALLARHHVFTEVDLLRIAIAVLDGLEAAHAANVIHRDIKESHILLRGDGSPVLIDFGATRIGLFRRRLLMSQGDGTEQMHSRPLAVDSSPWHDIHALGAMLYRIAGKSAGRSTDTAAQDFWSPQALAAIGRALEAKPESRPANVREWRADLEAALGALPVAAAAGLEALPASVQGSQATRVAKEPDDNGGLAESPTGEAALLFSDAARDEGAAEAIVPPVSAVTEESQEAQRPDSERVLPEADGPAPAGISAGVFQPKSVVVVSEAGGSSQSFVDVVPVSVMNAAPAPTSEASVSAPQPAAHEQPVASVRGGGEAGIAVADATLPPSGPVPGHHPVAEIIPLLISIATAETAPAVSAPPAVVPVAVTRKAHDSPRMRRPVKQVRMALFALAAIGLAVLIAWPLVTTWRSDAGDVSAGDAALSAPAPASDSAKAQATGTANPPPPPAAAAPEVAVEPSLTLSVTEDVIGTAATPLAAPAPVENLGAESAPAVTTTTTDRGTAMPAEAVTPTTQSAGGHSEATSAAPTDPVTVASVTETPARQPPVSESLGSTPPAQEAPVAPVANTPPAEPDKEMLLALAAADIKALRLTKPVGNNAWEKYQQVLRVDPQDESAREGMQTISARYAALARRAMGKGRYDQAERYLDLGERVSPDHTAVLEARADLDARKQRAHEEAQDSAVADREESMVERVQGTLERNMSSGSSLPKSRGEEVRERWGGR